MWIGIKRKHSVENLKEKATQHNAQKSKGTFFQAKLTVNRPGDKFEQEADAKAEEVMKESNQSDFSSSFGPMTIQKKCAECEEEERIQMKGSSSAGFADPETENGIVTEKGNGKPLNQETKTWMESRFGADFGDVKIHDGDNSQKLNKKLSARAFTHKNHIFFNSGEYNPTSNQGKKLLAHELTHVVQQSKGRQMVQRTVELRPPGRGEASAFERRQEMVDRLNALSSAVIYTLNDRVLEYELVEGVYQTFFDRSMIGFIDSAAVLPLRLITGAGLVGSSASGFSTLLIDSFMSGYLDLEDLLAGDDTSFQMNLMHILTERSMARDYARRIGSPSLSPVDASGNLTREFRRAHQAGNDAEASFLQDIFNDPTIRFTRERQRGQTLTFTFRSDEGYRVLHTFSRQNRTVSGGEVTVINAAGDTVTVEDFIQEREAAVAP